MSYKFLTITGADESTPLMSLKFLDNIYNQQIEFAFLLHQDKQGLSYRHPSKNYFKELDLLNLSKTSLHFCGSYWTNFKNLELGFEFLKSNRVQYNLGRRIYEFSYDNFSYLYKKAEELDIQIIIQTPTFLAPIFNEIKDLEQDKIVFLHDVSGDKGIVTNFESPEFKNLVGFAGGINIQNIADKLQEIKNLNIENDFWMDLETGARDIANRWDCNLVRMLCEQNKILKL